MYVNTGRLKDAEKMQNLIEREAMVKLPGYSMVELKGKIHTLVGDMRHPQHKEVYKYLKELSIKMEEAGYVPDTCSVLHDVDEEERRRESCCGFIVRNSQYVLQYSILCQARQSML